MSRIPASPQSVQAPAALPPTAKSTPTAPAAAPPVPEKPPVAAPQDQVSPLEKCGCSMPHLDLNIEETTPVKAPEPVSEAEIKWALALEENVVKGYQPTAAEFEKYADIAARLSDANPARQVPETEAEVSQDEMAWAQKLESQIKQGYQPTAKEVARYQDIFDRLQAQPQTEVTPAPVSQEDLDWALALETKVKQGYQPTAKDVARYEAIYNHMQTQKPSQKPSKSEPVAPTERPPAPSAPVAPAAPTAPAVSQEDLQWAADLMTKVQQGYTPGTKEVERYTRIYERYQAQQ